MKTLYSILLIVLLAGCGRAVPAETAVAIPTVPPAWLTKLPTPAITRSAEQSVATPQSPATAVPEPAISPTAAPSPTSTSLLGSLIGSEQTETRPLTVSAATGVPAEVVALAQQLTAAQPESFTWVEQGSADIMVTVNDGSPLVDWVYVEAGPFATIPDESSLDDLSALWAAVAAPETPLIVTADVAGTLSSLWGAPGPAMQVAADEALRENVWAERPSRTVLPFHKLTPDLKVLALDGLSPFDKGFDVSTYPLTIPVTLKGEETAVSQFRDQWPGPDSNYDPQKLTTIAMTGVTALVRATATQMEIDGILAPARDVGPVLRAVDFAHISNEVSFAPDCPEPNPVGGTSFCSQDDYFALLTEIGTDIVELTGNHLNDWGSENLVRTMDMYDQAGILTFGGGRNAAEAERPLLLEHNGNRIALTGCNYFGPSYAWATDTTPGSAVCGPEFLPQITKLKDAGYVVIATQQYTEYYQYPPMPDQAEDFHAIAAAGADAVSGSQGHHAQGFDFAGDAFIHYGLGNLFFDQMDMLGTRQTFVDTYTIYDGRLLNVSLWTGLIEDYFLPRLMTPEERQDTLQTVFEASGW